MGTNFYATFPTSDRWPPALPQGERIHLFKRSSAGQGALRFTWATDPVNVIAALAVIGSDERPFEDENVTASEMLADLLRYTTVNDYSMIGQDFS